MPNSKTPTQSRDEVKIEVIVTGPVGAAKPLIVLAIEDLMLIRGFKTIARQYSDGTETLEMVKQPSSVGPVRTATAVGIIAGGCHCKTQEK